MMMIKMDVHDCVLKKQSKCISQLWMNTVVVKCEVNGKAEICLNYYPKFEM